MLKNKVESVFFFFFFNCTLFVPESKKQWRSETQKGMYGSEILSSPFQSVLYHKHTQFVKLRISLKVKHTWVTSKYYNKKKSRIQEKGRKFLHLRNFFPASLRIKYYTSKEFNYFKAADKLIKHIRCNDLFPLSENP